MSLSEQEPAPPVAVFAAPDAVTAEMVRGVLEAEGIRAVIGEQVTDALAPSLQQGEGFWGEVLVAASDAAAARAVLAAYEAGQAGVSEEELASEAARTSDTGV